MSLSLVPVLAQQRGKATYYSRKANGVRMSDGTRYHSDSLVCAHRKYPFGSLLKVTNPSNGKHVVVRVADRGPSPKAESSIFPILPPRLWAFSLRVWRWWRWNSSRIQPKFHIVPSQSRSICQSLIWR